MKITTDAESALDNQRPSFLADGMLVVLLLALANFLLHLYFNNRYDYFRDEFDYMACGNHLAWGYVDQPPLIPFLIKLSWLVLGDSLRSIRIIPALATSAAVILTAMTARELGGRRFAMVLSALAFIAVPIYLNDGSVMTTNCLEPLLWTGCIYFTILAIKREDARYWLWFGVVAGIGLEEKYSIAVLGLCIIVGLLLTEQRRILARKWIWLGGALAFVVFLPNFIWNVQNHWPFVELMRNIKADGRDVVLSPPVYFAQQVLKCPESLAVCGTHAQHQVYLAAGAIVIESYIARSRQVWLKPALIALILAAGASLAPLVMPVLPVDQFISYMEKMPFKVPRSEHSHMRAILPQHFADQFGWEEMVAEVNQAYMKLSPEERAGCGIFAQDYGQAGAIDFFGRRYGLPPALSGHQTYFLWGPRGYSGNCMIVLDDSPEVLERHFERVEYVGKSADNPYALEREIPVFICHGAKFGSLADVWPQLKKWR